MYDISGIVFRWGDNGTISAGGFGNLRYFEQRCFEEII